MTDHARAALDGYGPVLLARHQWITSGSDADKARFDAAAREYRARFDCSCPTDGPRVCDCVYTPAPHADADETTTRFDSHSQELPMPTFDHFLRLAGGDYSQASVLQFQHVRDQRLAASPKLRSDAVDDAEAAMRLRHLTAHCRTDEEVKQVQRRLAEQASQEAERKRFRDNATRMDAATPAAPESIVDRAERQMQERSRNAYRTPLQVSKSRFPTDGGGNEAA